MIEEITFIGLIVLGVPSMYLVIKLIVWITERGEQ